MDSPLLSYKHPREWKRTGLSLTYHSEGWCWETVAKWKPLWMPHFPSCWLPSLSTGNGSEVHWKRRHRQLFWNDSRLDTCTLWVFATDSCSLLNVNNKTGGKECRKMWQGWLGSEASLHTCWEKCHHQRSSDDNVQGQPSHSWLFAHTPRKNCSLCTLQSSNDRSPVLRDIDCSPYKRIVLGGLWSSSQN